MKKIVYALVLIIGLPLLVGFGAKVATTNSTSDIASAVDSLNPLVRPSTVYVKTVAPQKVDHHGMAFYQQMAVTKDGGTRPIGFMGMKELQVDHYLAIDIKGAYVKTYREVAREDLPAAVLAEIDEEK